MIDRSSQELDGDAPSLSPKTKGELVLLSNVVDIVTASLDNR